MTHLMGEFDALRLEVEGDSPEMAFGRVGMGNLLAQGDLDLKQLVGRNLVRRFDDWHMLLFLPASPLNAFT